MKRVSKAQGFTFLGAVLLSAISAPVLAEVQGNITLASNYIWRGIDQNNANPAIQGGLDLNFENGLYTGVWASNVQGAQATNNIEMDLYAGYTRSMNDFGWDLAYIRYEYPKADPDLEELMLQGSYKGLSLAYYHNLDDPAAGESEYYVRAKAEVNLPGAVGLTLAMGQSAVKNGDDINDGLIGFSKFAAGVTFGISLTTSNLDHVTNTDIETDFVTVSVSKAM